MRRSVILGACLLVLAYAGRAQNTALRLTLGEIQRMYEAPNFSFLMGLGIDRSFNNHLAVGLAVGLDLNSYSKYHGFSVGQGPNSYSVVPKLWSVTYHTEYSFAGDFGPHIYVGTFLGLNMVDQEWRIGIRQEIDEYSYSNLTVKKTLIPVGVRVGLKGEPEGSHMDLYAAHGYQIGGGKLAFPDAPRAAEYAKFSAMSITLGLSYGIGW